MVTGTKSHTRLEHTGRIKDTLSDPTMPEHIRAMAETAWHDITTNGASPEKQWKQIRAAITEHNTTDAEPLAGGGQDDPAELAAVAQAALARPREPRPKESVSDDASTATEPGTPRPLATLVADLDEWISHADADALAADTVAAVPCAFPPAELLLDKTGLTGRTRSERASEQWCTSNCSGTP